jgi:hypothetical protein
MMLLEALLAEGEHASGYQAFVLLFGPQALVLQFGPQALVLGFGPQAFVLLCGPQAFVLLCGATRCTSPTYRARARRPT